jgi:hypothetical protein
VALRGIVEDGSEEDTERNHELISRNKSTSDVTRSRLSLIVVNANTFPWSASPTYLIHRYQQT